MRDGSLTQLARRASSPASDGSLKSTSNQIRPLPKTSYFHGQWPRAHAYAWRSMGQAAHIAHVWYAAWRPARQEVPRATEGGRKGKEPFSNVFYSSHHSWAVSYSSHFSQYRILTATAATRTAKARPLAQMIAISVALAEPMIITLR